MSQEQNSPEVKIINLANAVTALRLVLLPVIIYGIVTTQGLLAVLAMGAVVLTDLVDGRIARRLGQASAFGGMFDSIIDFVMIYSLFISCYASGRLTIFQFAILYIAMFSTFLLQISAMGSGRSEGILRTRSGKITGALEYGYLLFLVVREVLPDKAVISIFNWIFFGALAIMIMLSSIGAVIRLRRMV